MLKLKGGRGRGGRMEEVGLKYQTAHLMMLSIVDSPSDRSSPHQPKRKEPSVEGKQGKDEVISWNCEARKEQTVQHIRPKLRVSCDCNRRCCCWGERSKNMRRKGDNESDLPV